jgi:hypothetical protein
MSIAAHSRFTASGDSGPEGPMSIEEAEAYAAFTSFRDEEVRAESAAARAALRDRKVALARAAAAVSHAQGLPAGQYDFRCLSEAQLSAVVNDMIANRPIAAYGWHGHAGRL